MAAAVPAIGQIIVTYVTSRAISKVGQKIGLSDSQAGLLGAIGGIYAGGAMMGGGAPDPMTDATRSGFDQGGGGMLTDMPQGVPGSPSQIASPQIQAPAPVPPQIDAPVQTSAVNPPPPVVDKPWYETLWNDDTSRNVMVGGASGAAQAYLGADAEEDRYRRERREEDERRNRWENFDAKRVPRLQYPDFVRPRGGMLSENP